MLEREVATVKIGTCGWGRLYQAVPPSEREGKTALQVYASYYPVVEVNSSFYRFQRVSTYRKWRDETPPNFEFTLKCHQSVSHEERLAPTEKALEGLKGMVERERACGAKALLIQTPGSLRADEGAFRAADEFFNKARREGLPLAWETRGRSWEEEAARQKLAILLKRHGITHVTDPLKLNPVHTTGFAYFRLHGLPRYNLRYTYTNRELLRLHERLKAYEEEVETVYVFFNNYAMYRDATRLITLDKEGKLPPSPFGPASVRSTLSTFEDWPATKSQLLEKCGGWYCWVTPDKSVKINQILKFFSKGEYASLQEAEGEAERIWRKTGYPSARQVEETKASEV